MTGRHQGRILRLYVTPPHSTCGHFCSTMGRQQCPNSRLQNIRPQTKVCECADWVQLILLSLFRAFKTTEQNRVRAVWSPERGQVRGRRPKRRVTPCVCAPGVRPPAAMDPDTSLGTTPPTGGTVAAPDREPNTSQTHAVRHAADVLLSCSLSGCPRAKKSGIKVLHSKEEKEDQESIK